MEAEIWWHETGDDQATECSLERERPPEEDGDGAGLDMEIRKESAKPETDEESHRFIRLLHADLFSC